MVLRCRTLQCLEHTHGKRWIDLLHPTPPMRVSSSRRCLAILQCPPRKVAETCCQSATVIGSSGYTHVLHHLENGCQALSTWSTVNPQSITPTIRPPNAFAATVQLVATERSWAHAGMTGTHSIRQKSPLREFTNGLETQCFVQPVIGTRGLVFGFRPVRPTLTPPQTPSLFSGLEFC